VTIAQTMSDSPGSIDFLNLMRTLESSNSQKPRIGESHTYAEDIVSLGQLPYVEFADTNVAQFVEKENGLNLVLTRFLGLLGPQGALPLHTTYEATHWLNMRDPAFARFLDVFNNRFQQLFFRVWANARPAVQADRPRDNQFVNYIGSMIGIGTASLRQRDSLHDFTKLAIAGLISPSVKSAARVENMLTWLFKAKVAVQQFIGVWLPLDEQEQAVLAKGNCSLGVDSLIGKSAFSLRDKFRVRLEVLDLKEFETFLPDGKHFQSMADAIKFYLGDVFIYDVEIGMAQSETKATKLGQFGRLGWTSWMKSPQDSGDNIVRWDCRFHPDEINRQIKTDQAKDSKSWPM
jgi:type VI secretion system protein ImpH